MTFFESASLLAHYLQLLLIGSGLLMMHRAGVRRDRQLDVMLAQSEATTRSLEESTRSLVEQGREQTRALKAQTQSLEAQTQGLKDLLRRTG